MKSKTPLAAAALAVVSWAASATIATADPDQPPAPDPGTAHTPGPAAPGPAPDPAAPAAAGPKNTIDKDGIYVVGTDIVPGTYATAGPVGNGRCYWRRMNNPDPMVKGNVIDSALSAKPQVVAIDPADKAFKTSGCQPWHPTDQPADAPGTTISPQMKIALDVLGGLASQGGGSAPAPKPGS
ncbi:hypothetical protein [Mycobacterium sp. OTB74]|uniref:hypothetical protein n=1 Tax=Mycobacterium sp. OTB74 TaxID=1853452 RepID=UPI00247462F8|nr:hypothetical protein [Mycobacterium sp. OTB74]MDH6246807.1 hypothetical protein [Mycobacterium sp. OTB74]